jgi:hypothetical protein
MDDERQKTQVALALANESRGEAPKRIGGGTESATAEPDTESLAEGQLLSSRQYRRQKELGRMSGRGEAFAGVLRAAP